MHTHFCHNIKQHNGVLLVIWMKFLNHTILPVMTSCLYLVSFMFLHMHYSSMSGTEDNRISELKSSASSTLVTTAAGKLEQQQQSVVIRTTTTVISSTASGTVTSDTTTVNSTSHAPDSELFSELCLLCSVVKTIPLIFWGKITHRCKEWQRIPYDHLERKFKITIGICHLVCPVSHYVNYETWS